MRPVRLRTERARPFHINESISSQQCINIKIEISQMSVDPYKWT
jgi:hypothetical protein